MSRAVPSARRIAGSLSAVGAVVVGLGLAGCSTGQITQTSSQVATVDGANGEVGPLTLANITLSYPDSGQWSEGDSPELNFTITSTSLQADTLESVSSDAADSGLITTTPTNEASPGVSPSPTGAEAAEESDAPSSGDAPGASGSLEIPAQGLVRVPNDDAEVTLDSLTESLLPTQVVQVTFTFAQAGEVTIGVPVATPEDAQERGEEFDFHEEHAEP